MPEINPIAIPVPIAMDILNRVPFGLAGQECPASLGWVGYRDYYLITFAFKEDRTLRSGFAAHLYLDGCPQSLVRLLARPTDALRAVRYRKVTPYSSFSSRVMRACKASFGLRSS